MVFLLFRGGGRDAIDTTPPAGKRNRSAAYARIVGKGMPWGA